MRCTFSRTKAISAIYTILKDVYSNIYHERVPQGTSLPYATFNIGLATQREGGSSNFILEIDVWDNKGSNITELEGIVDDIMEGLYKRICSYDDFVLRFEDADINPVPDEDENIRRRNISVNTFYYNK